MHEIREWISDALRDTDPGIKEIPPDAARAIVSKAMDQYVSGHPRSWWMSLSGAYQRVSSEGLSLTKLFPDPDGNAYLIPETEEEALPVYSGSIQDLEKLLDACPFFEYYIVAMDESWLVIESDHNEYFLCGAIRVEMDT